MKIKTALIPALFGMCCTFSTGALAGGVDELAGKTWILLSIEKAGTPSKLAPVWKQPLYTLRFSIHWKISGEVSCNKLGGEWGLGKRGNLSLRDTYTTATQCSYPVDDKNWQQALAAMDADFVVALDDAYYYRVKGNQLKLLSKDRRETLHFVAE